MYVKACRRYRRWEKNIQTHFYHTFLNMVSFECNPMYVEDVEDRSNTPKAVMLCMLKMSKMSKIDQIHLRAVMLCMLKMSKMGKEHTHTFWLITSLILNGFSIRKKFWKAETESFTTIPSNPMYVEDVEDGKRTYRHTFIIPFLIWYHLNVILCMLKMSKIDQIHLRAVMLCMLKMSKMGKEHTHTSSTCFDIHRI